MSSDAPAAELKLAAFRRRRKFSDAQWRKRGLEPSSRETSVRLESALNAVAKELRATLGSPDTRRAVDPLLRRALFKINRDEYDTEEAEFICDCFAVLAEIVDAKFAPELNAWLLGEELGRVVTEQAQRETGPQVLRKLPQDCTACAAVLETAITALRPDNESEAWLAVECIACGGLNFVVLCSSRNRRNADEWIPAGHSVLAP